jgi:Na+-driven multidrug efflux pump
MPGEWSYSIAGQLSWVNLLYEIMDEAIILPLFFFMGKNEKNRDDFTNKLKSGLLVSGLIYAVLATVIMIFAVPLLNLMAASPEIISDSATYIRIESIANIFGILYRFALVALVTIGADKKVYWLTGLKVLLCVILDTFLISGLPVSLNLGVNGIGVSNIITNAVLLVITLLMLAKSGYNVCNKNKLSFAWMKDFVKIGGISGVESLVRNVAYMVMVSRMVNMVGEQGTYWVANNFIWGWMLLPVTQLAELIKQEVATNKNAVKENSKGYFALTGFICLAWVILIPLYKPFMLHVLGYSDVDKLFSLVMMLFAFYVMYAFQNVFDATFYGAGRTEYMLFESIVTNTIYYGGFFIAYLCGVWIPTLTGIALMFGFGNAFDSVVSWLAYRHFVKRRV